MRNKNKKHTDIEWNTIIKLNFTTGLEEKEEINNKSDEDGTSM